MGSSTHPTEGHHFTVVSQYEFDVAFLFNTISFVGGTAAPQGGGRGKRKQEGGDGRTTQEANAALNHRRMGKQHHPRGGGGGTTTLLYLTFVCFTSVAILAQGFLFCCGFVSRSRFWRSSLWFVVVVLTAQFRRNFLQSIGADDHSN